MKPLEDISIVILRIQSSELHEAFVALY